MASRVKQEVGSPHEMAFVGCLPRRAKRMTARPRLLILTHSNCSSLQGYFLALLVSEWEMQGIEVLYSARLRFLGAGRRLFYSC